LAKSAIAVFRRCLQGRKFADMKKAALSSLFHVGKVEQQQVPPQSCGFPCRLLIGAEKPVRL